MPLLAMLNINKQFYKFYCFILAILVVGCNSNPFGSENQKIVFSAESKYQNIYVSKTNSILAMHTGSLRSKASAIDLNNREKLVLRYTKLMMLGLGYNSKPLKVLFIGLGGGSVPRYLRKFYPDLVIHNVELDEKVLETAIEYFGFSTDEKMNVFIEDGRRFLVKSDEKYDIIFLDAYYGGYIPFHLLTSEFLEIVKSHLNKKGIVVSNTWASQKLYERESATYSHVFNHFDSFLDLKSKNRIIIASNNSELGNQELIEQKLERVQNQMRFPDIDLPALYRTHLDRNVTWPSSTKILTDNFAPVNLLVGGDSGFK